jgi:hypothetical protein
MNKAATSLIFFLILSFGLCTYVQEDTKNGNGLIIEWKAYKAYQGGGPANFGTGFFLGYVKGFRDSLYLTDSIYIPEGVTLGQMCLVVGKYLEDHPEKLHQDMYILVREALTKAFPKK